jgi:50S ribosomal subunit-associated GTPase HflX
MMGRRVVIVGLFSAKDKGAEAAMRELEAAVVRAGNVVVGRVVQRRGVSRSRTPGGARRMDAPMNAATYIGTGKAEEVAELCRRFDADLVVVRGAPSPTQIDRLREVIGREVIASPLVG